MAEIVFELCVYAPTLRAAQVLAKKRFTSATQLSPNGAQWSVQIAENEGDWEYHFTAVV